MKYCTKCGKNIDSEAEYCSSCGNCVTHAKEISNKTFTQTYMSNIFGTGMEDVSIKSRFVRHFAGVLCVIQVVIAHIIGLIGIVFILTTDNMFFVDAQGIFVGLIMLIIAVFMTYGAKFTKFRIQLFAHQVEDTNAIRNMLDKKQH